MVNCFRIFYTTIGMFLLCSSNPSPYEESILNYDIVLGNSTIGYLKCIQRNYTASGMMVYIIDSKVDVQVIKKFNVHYTLYSKYSGSKLYYSKLINVVNSDTQRFNQVTLGADRFYRFQEKDNLRITKDTMIDYSVACLYHKEPKTGQRLFTENFLQSCAISGINHTYSITFPDGNTNSYTYVNGICEEAKIQQKWYTLYFKRKH